VEFLVRSLTWCAVATYVLIAIVKKELKLDASLYTCLQILSVSIFEKTEILCALQPSPNRTGQSTFANSRPDTRFGRSLLYKNFLERRDVSVIAPRLM